METVAVVVNFLGIICVINTVVAFGMYCNCVEINLKYSVSK